MFDQVVGVIGGDGFSEGHWRAAPHFIMNSRPKTSIMKIQSSFSITVLVLNLRMRTIPKKLK
jgi:hypothetical protein